jgi:glycosyltransferase involved in cell wall biosynthesis
VASMSYWLLSPSFIVAMLGKFRGWDRTKPTPAVDWRTVSVDAVIPAKNEEATIALALASLYRQDFPLRKVTVVDDGSTDRTADVVRRFQELSGRPIELLVREKSEGKTPTLRHVARASDAGALLVLDGDTVLVDPHYVSRCVQELYKNASVASACGEVRPWSRRRRQEMAASDPVVQALDNQFGILPAGRPSRLEAWLEGITVTYRRAVYLFLQRVLYDGHLKMCGSQMSPMGCAVVYQRSRLLECFDFAQPQMGDNLSNSEDIFIGHYFTWKGYRNFQIFGLRCESKEPSVLRLPRQLYLWSSGFLQALYYFKDLPLSPLRKMKSEVAGVFGAGEPETPPEILLRRQIQEQYRSPWGEHYTRKYGRLVGLLDLCGLVEKFIYPLVLLFLIWYDLGTAALTVALEVVLSALAVFIVADPGARLQSAGFMVAATPLRLLSMGVDIYAVGRCCLDVCTGNRKWRK